MSRTSSAAALPKAPQPITPLLVDIKTASQTLGISVFAVRNLCWHRETALILKPVRHGLKFLFSPAALTEFAQKLVSGEVRFPATPTKPKARKRAAA